MVYSKSLSRAIVSEKPLSTTRSQGTHSKQVREFASNYTVFVQTDGKGKPTIKTNKK